MNNMTRIATSLVAVACAALAGCSTLNTAGHEQFACDETDNCPTPFEVYNQTNVTPTQVKNGRTPESWKVEKRGKGDEKSQTAMEIENLRLDLVSVAPSSQAMVPADPAARPLREPSQVMRIWIAPWIDQTDNLNWPGYIYTEVTKRRWSYGEQEVRHQGMPPQFLPR